MTAVLAASQNNKQFTLGSVRLPRVSFSHASCFTLR